MSKLTIAQYNAELSTWDEDEPAEYVGDDEYGYPVFAPKLHDVSCACADCVGAVAQHEAARAIGAIVIMDGKEFIDATLFAHRAGHPVHGYQKSSYMFQAVWMYTREIATELGCLPFWSWVQDNPWYGKEASAMTPADHAAFTAWLDAGGHYYKGDAA